MTRKFVRLPNFESCWKKCGLSDKELVELEIALCSNPKLGKVVQGTGGLRKLRWAVPGSGKRGSVRVVYVDFAVYEKLYLISAYTKNEKNDLSDSEKKYIKKLIGLLDNELRKK